MIDIAIVVGNEKYELQSDLECCGRDVDAIHKLLEATEKYKEIKVVKNASSDELKTRLREIFGEYSEVNELFFYFTGHGTQSDGDFYLMPVDFEETRPNETGLSLTDLHTLFHSVKTKLIVNVIDACQSGTSLIKNGSHLLLEPKEAFRGYIRIASSLENQDSLTGKPLSEFTQQFYEAVISKEKGEIYYTDIINSLRDRFLNHSMQTPHFVAQITGQEVFADSATKFRALRDKMNAELASKDEGNLDEQQLIQAQLSPIELLEKLESTFPTKEIAQVFVKSLGNDIANAVREELKDHNNIYEIESDSNNYYGEEVVEEFIVRVLSREDRLDNFVSAEILRVEKEEPSYGAAAMLGSIWSGLNRKKKYEDVLQLIANCSIESVQLRISLVPKFKSLRRWNLIVSFAPSLKNCYVFEHVFANKLSDWDGYDGEGKEVERRWYLMGWEEQTEGVISKISSSLRKLVVDEIADVTGKIQAAEGNVSRDK